ncbi:MAG: hypothetical protein NUV60_02410 [Patescibacteria group bacterium]|nr:hypothetical protein [Patescibacteria group bacterium]
MPQKRNNSKPPKVTTWSSAAPILVVAAIFDALRFMFEWFIFFGPALAALYCTVKAGAVVGTTIGGIACTAGAATIGFFGSTGIEALGMVMAMATGFAGWLTVGLMLIMFNGRIFKENALWFVASLAVSEIPFVGSIPAITIAVWRMYHIQIKKEKGAYKKWEKENADAQLKERNQQASQFAQIQAAQQQQFAQQEAVNDAVYAQAANDERYRDEEIPDEVRRAA